MNEENRHFVPEEKKQSKEVSGKTRVFRDEEDYIDWEETPINRDTYHLFYETGGELSEEEKDQIERIEEEFEDELSELDSEKEEWRDSADPEDDPDSYDKKMDDFRRRKDELSLQKEAAIFRVFGKKANNRRLNAFVQRLEYFESQYGKKAVEDF
ncbi:hypothetical protein KKC60_00090 [Patescibacteria group bacterium]|nr:hypothetical protein [Patescibacteria group bacterium]